MNVEKLNYEGKLRSDWMHQAQYFEQVTAVGTESTKISLQNAYGFTLSNETGTSAISFRVAAGPGLLSTDPDYLGVKQVLRNELTGTLTLGGNFNTIVSGTSLGTEAITVVTALAGTKQVETATCAGTVTTAGNAACTITSALLGTTSPLTVAFAVEEADEGAEIATALRNALNATAAVTAHYIVGGTDAAVSLTAKLCAADDATLNIAIDDGTGEGASEGVTTAATSENSAAGVALDTIASALGKIVTAINADETLGTYVTASAVSDKYLVLTRDAYAANDTSLVASFENDTTVGLNETDSVIYTEGDAPNDGHWFTLASDSTFSVNPPSDFVPYVPFTKLWTKSEEDTFITIFYWGFPTGTPAVCADVDAEE